MEVFEVRDAFGLEHLQQGERPDPRPQPGEVLLELLCASLNYRDLMMVRGEYDRGLPLPFIPCSDAVGVVVEMGSGVENLTVGTRVCPLFAPFWQAGKATRERMRAALGGRLDGTLRSRMALPASAVVPVPDYLSDPEAATLPCAALTAWSALVTHGGVTAGDTVLVQGTGGVAIAALQIAQLLGARVILTSSQDEKLARARKLGAWQGINYRQETAWGRRAKELTGGEGVDHVIDLGGGETLGESLQAVRIGGSVSVIGVLSGVQAPLSVSAILMRQVRIQGIYVGNRDGFEDLVRAYAHHQPRPVVDRVFPFAETPNAFRHLASGAHFGKVVVGLGGQDR